jgi:uncharacterized protein YjiS (DUF1127 family)
MHTADTTASFAAANRTLRKRAVSLLGYCSRHLNNWISGASARWERRKPCPSLSHLSDRELKDIGLYRSGIDAALAEIARTKTRWAQTGEGFEDAAS